MENIQLSENFYLMEFLESQTARRTGIVEQFSPPDYVVNNLKLLCKNVLQPLRNKAGAITISSGWRCDRLNKAVGGSPTSEHCYGMASDIKGIALTNKQLFDLIVELKLPYTQRIWEYGTKNNPAWVHVSYNQTNLKKQTLYIGI